VAFEGRRAGNDFPTDPEGQERERKSLRRTAAHRGKPWLPFRRLRAEHRPSYPIVVHDRRRLQGPVRFELPQAAVFAGTSRDGSDGPWSRERNHIEIRE